MSSFSRTTAFATIPVSPLTEPELSAWAEQRTLDAHPRSSLINVGAIGFWMVVACLLLARVLLVDVTTLRPEASNNPAAATSMVKISAASRAAVAN